METLIGLSSGIGIIVMLFLFVFGGWKVILYIISFVIGGILGFFPWLVRILIKSTFNYDILSNQINEYDEPGDKLFSYALVGVFSGFSLVILYGIIISIKYCFLGGITLGFLFLIGNTVVWIISKIFKIKHKPNLFLAAIVGNIILIIILFFGYHLCITILECI